MSKWEYNNKTPILIKEEAHAYICQCVNCGKEFRRHKANCAGKIPKYCSIYCKNHDTKNWIKKICPNCGNVFELKSYNKSQKCCCQKCGIEYRDKQKIGNKSIDKLGYVHIYLGKGKHKLEHILVMEQAIGRELNADECVHHRDFNPANNDISNLQLMTKSEHSKFHRNYEIEHYGHVKSRFNTWNKGKKLKSSWNAKKVVRIEDGKIFDSVRKCHIETGISQKSIKLCCEDPSHAVRNMHFAYYNKNLHSNNTDNN